MSGTPAYLVLATPLHVPLDSINDSCEACKRKVYRPCQAGDVALVCSECLLATRTDTDHLNRLISDALNAQVQNVLNRVSSQIPLPSWPQVLEICTSSYSKHCQVLAHACASTCMPEELKSALELWHSRDGAESQPLHHLALYGVDSQSKSTLKQCLELLLDAKADIHAKVRCDFVRSHRFRFVSLVCVQVTHYTPIRIAVQQNNTKMVTLLLDARADIKDKDPACEIDLTRSLVSD